MTKQQIYICMAASLCAFWGSVGFMLWEAFK